MSFCPRAAAKSSSVSSQSLGTPVVGFYPFYFGVSLLKLNSRKKGTLVIMGLLGNLEVGVALQGREVRV